MDEQWLVVGLGNPGPGYAGNRHNVGQMALDVLAHRIDARFKTHKTNSTVAEGRTAPGGPRLVLAKPNSFMNLSGGPVSALMAYYDIDVDRVIVLHDELDIPFDTVKVKRGGGHGGHNGIRDIAAAAGSPEFARVRIGVGRPPGRMAAADFVLRDFVGSEREVLPNLLEDAVDATGVIIIDGLEAAQMKFHAPKDA